MTYSDLKIALLANAKSKYGQGVSEGEIGQAETSIGPIVGDYRKFLLDFGWATIGHSELFGLGHDVTRANDLISNTLDERNYGRVPSLLPVMNDGAGNLFCVEQSSSVSPSPVIMSTHDSDSDYVINEEGFSDWLLELIHSLDTKVG